MSITDQFEEDAIIEEKALDTKPDILEKRVDALEEILCEWFSTGQQVHSPFPDAIKEKIGQQSLSTSVVNLLYTRIWEHSKEKYFSCIGKFFSPVVQEAYDQGANNFEFAAKWRGKIHKDIHINWLRYVVGTLAEPVRVTFDDPPPGNIGASSGCLVLGLKNYERCMDSRTIGGESHNFTLIYHDDILDPGSTHTCFGAGTTGVYGTIVYTGKARDTTHFAKKHIAVHDASPRFGELATNTHFYTSNPQVLIGLQNNARSGCSFTLLSKDNPSAVYGIPNLFEFMEKHKPK